jgi:toxin ParE1/3/4
VTRRKLIWYPGAVEDLDDIVESLRSRGSHVNAERVLNRIEHAVATLRTSANRGRVVSEFAAHGISQYREAIVPRWRIVYRVDGVRVLVLTVIDSRRRLDELLIERLVRAQ